MYTLLLANTQFYTTNFLLDGVQDQMLKITRISQIEQDTSILITLPLPYSLVYKIAIIFYCCSVKYSERKTK